jgi:conserved domain protein
MDYLVQAVVAIIVAWTIIKVAWFTIKRVATNIFLGMITYAIVTEVFHVSMDMNIMLWALTAVLGPIPVLGLAYFHW